MFVFFQTSSDRVHPTGNPFLPLNILSLTSVDISIVCHGFCPLNKRMLTVFCFCNSLRNGFLSHHWRRKEFCWNSAVLESNWKQFLLDKFTRHENSCELISAEQIATILILPTYIFFN